MPYDDEFWGEELGAYPPEDKVKVEAEKILAEAKAYATKRGGDAYLENYMPARFCVRMRLPF